MTSIDKEFIEIQDEDIYDYKSVEHKPPFNTDYTELNVDDCDEEVMRLTVGNNGKNFNKITEDNKIAYIYHNKDTNKIEIWGKKEKLNKVKQQITNYINWSKNYVKNRNTVQ